MDEKMRSRIIGVVLVVIGGLFLAENYLNLGDIGGSIFLIAVGAALLAGWSKTLSLALLIAGACTSALGVFTILENLIHLGDWSGPLFFASQGAAFYTVYKLDKARPRWSWITALSLLGFACFIGLVEGSGVASKVVLPVVIILAGIWIALGKRN